MQDLISRQAAIDALKDMYHAAEKWGKEATDDVIKARAESCMASLIEMKLRIEKLPSAQPQWIPVTERLPEEYKDVLCYYEYFRYGDYNCMFRTIDRGYYGNGIWGGEAGQGHKNKVLAWMPLPDPWKGEQE